MDSEGGMPRHKSLQVIAEASAAELQAVIALALDAASPASERRNILSSESGLPLHGVKVAKSGVQDMGHKEMSPDVGQSILDCLIPQDSPSTLLAFFRSPPLQLQN